MSRRGEVTLYGIAACDTIRKARRWLDAHGVAYRFHDYRRDGVDAVRVADWAAEHGWERLLNRSGTTFRRLPPADREHLDAARALGLMGVHPAVIRRPILDLGDRRLVGFSPEAYAAAMPARG